MLVVFRVNSCQLYLPLSSGTGFGLSLCKKIAELLDGEIYLDETFDSGIVDCPGSRFVVRLNIQPLDLQAWTLSEPGGSNVSSEGGMETELPKEFRVLFVDDDMVLRKLFSRALKRVAPIWNVHEAANGETALRLIDEEDYDLIFLDQVSLEKLRKIMYAQMSFFVSKACGNSALPSLVRVQMHVKCDLAKPLCFPCNFFQYMSSIQKQMLGTETVRALRSKGFKGTICGLSANAMEEAFLAAGADAFMIKVSSKRSALQKSRDCI